jgi:hypothetical protein
MSIKLQAPSETHLQVRFPKTLDARLATLPAANFNQRMHLDELLWVCGC